MRVLWHIWDGAAAWVVDALVAQGSLPTTAFLREQGRWGSAEAPRPNCQTPAGLATLLTGTPPAVHGITGFWVPGSAPTTRKIPVRGFSEGLLQAKPLWEHEDFVSTLVSVHAPWVIKNDGTVPPTTTLASDALNARVAREGSIALPDETAGSVLPFPDAGSPDAIVVHRIDGQVFLREQGHEIRLDGHWRSIWTNNDSGRWYRTSRHADGTLLVVRSGMWRTRFVGSAAEVDKARSTQREIGPFLGDAMGALYRSGAFGQRLVDGGSGEAESILLDAAEIVLDTMWEPFKAVSPGDLSVYYSPIADDIGHELAGLLNTEEPSVRRAAWGIVERAYRLLDDALAWIIERISPEIVVISADHGIAPIRRTFLPNVVLQDAGLTHSDEAGEADPNVSDVWYHIAGTGLLLSNHSGLTGGRLCQTEARQALGKAMKALEEAVDDRGVPAVHSFTDCNGNLVSPDDPPSDEVYVIFRSDVLPIADLPNNSSAWLAPQRSGAHVTNDGDPRLRATYTVSTLNSAQASIEQGIDNRELAGTITEYLRKETTWSR